MIRTTHNADQRYSFYDRARDLLTAISVSQLVRWAVGLGRGLLDRNYTIRIDMIGESGPITEATDAEVREAIREAER